MGRKTKPAYQREVEEIKEEPWGVAFHKALKLTAKQKSAVEMISKNKVTIITGPAGTSKTFCAAYAALKEFQDNDDVYRIVITKPTEIVGDTALGFTPGTLDEKLSIYMENFQDVFEDLISLKDLEMMVTAKEVQYKAPQFVRGRTLKNSIVIIDEFQSFDIKQLMAIATRLGKQGTRMIFCGDIKQNDINQKYVAVNLFKEIMDGIPGAAQFEFTEEDNMRDPMVKAMLAKFDALEAAGKLTPNKKNA